MSRSIFGWDLPPGCSARDIDNAMGIDEENAPETEQMLTLWLEAAQLRTTPNAKTDRRLERIEDKLCQLVNRLARDRDGAREQVREYETMNRMLERTLMPILQAIVKTGTVSPDQRDTIYWFLENFDL